MDIPARGFLLRRTGSEAAL